MTATITDLLTSKVQTQRELVEDLLDGIGWPWDAGLSLLLDELILEEERNP